MTTHSSRSASLMFQLDIYIYLSLGRTGRRCSYRDVHSLLQTSPLDSLPEFTVEINMNKNQK